MLAYKDYDSRVVKTYVHGEQRDIKLWQLVAYDQPQLHLTYICQSGNLLLSLVRLVSKEGGGGTLLENMLYNYIEENVIIVLICMQSTALVSSVYIVDWNMVCPDEYTGGRIWV